LLVDAKKRSSDKDLPVHAHAHIHFFCLFKRYICLLPKHYKSTDNFNQTYLR
jgi:hypothetical protein